MVYAVLNDSASDPYWSESSKGEKKLPPTLLLTPCRCGSQEDNNGAVTDADVYARSSGYIHKQE